MAKRGGARPGGGRPKTSDRDDVTVKLDRTVAARARYIADVRDITLAEYLTTITAATVDRDFAAASAAVKPPPSDKPKP